MSSVSDLKSSILSNINNSISAPINIQKMFSGFPEAKLNSLISRIKNVLSTRLGDAIDTKVAHNSGVYTKDDQKGSITGFIATSLKDELLRSLLVFKNTFFNDFRSSYGKIPNGQSYTYDLKSIRRSHQQQTAICTMTPHLDPLIQTALAAAAEADSQYAFGLELDMTETQKQNQLVFAIFEKESEKEISRVLIPESQL